MGEVYTLLQELPGKGEIETEPVEVSVTNMLLIVVGGTTILSQNWERPVFGKSIKITSTNCQNKFLELIFKCKFQ